MENISGLLTDVWLTDLFVDLFVSRVFDSMCLLQRLGEILHFNSLNFKNLDINRKSSNFPVQVRNVSGTVYFYTVSQQGFYHWYV